MMSFHSTLFTVSFRRRYVQVAEKRLQRPRHDLLQSRGMFHGYHDARQPLLHPCNNKGKTPASSGYKSQRMYYTEGEKGGRTRQQKQKT
jgi:hypothetical protein